MMHPFVDEQIFVILFISDKVLKLTRCPYM